MISNKVKVKVVESPEVAPTYPVSVKPLIMDACIVVNNGTVNGNSTVDLQMIDKDGKKYLVMTTGEIIKTLANIIEGSKKVNHTNGSVY